MPILILIVLFACLLAPHAAIAAEVVKDPLNYPLRQYGFVLAISLLGGFVAWYAKVRKGELVATNLSALVGELTTSALSGLLAFYICEYLNFAPVLTAAIVGVAGHMGTRAISWAEEWLKKRADRLLGTEDKPKEPPQ